MCNKSIDYLSVFALSKDNVEKRINSEKKIINELLYRKLKTLSDLSEIKVNVIGDISIFDDRIHELISELESDIIHNPSLVLTVALNYSGRDDILNAIQAVVSKGLTTDDFKDNLSEVLIEKIEPISKEINKLMNEKDFLDKILLEGCKKANNIASDKVKKMQEIIGF